MEGLSQRPESLTPEGPNGFAVTAHMGSRLEGRFTGTCMHDVCMCGERMCILHQLINSMMETAGTSPRQSRKSQQHEQQQQQQHQHDASPPPSTHGKGKIDLSGAEAQALKVCIGRMCVVRAALSACVCSPRFHRWLLDVFLRTRVSLRTGEAAKKG